MFCSTATTVAILGFRAQRRTSHSPDTPEPTVGHWGRGGSEVLRMKNAAAVVQNADDGEMTPTVAHSVATLLP